MIQPLTAVTLEASEIVQVADVPALLNAQVAITALPPNKTIDQISSISLNKQPNGTFKVDYRFSS
jgi:hypothetical protein